jgi:hypothetical protein
MEKWKNIKRSWEWLIKSLPKLLTKNGQYLYFGDEPDCTPYSICRTKVGWRDCWVIADNGEDSTAIILECSHTAVGYLPDVKDWLWNALGLEFNEPIYVCEHIMGHE